MRPGVARVSCGKDLLKKQSLPELFRIAKSKKEFASGAKVDKRGLVQRLQDDHQNLVRKAFPSTNAGACRRSVMKELVP
jgi:hypothetical protein